MRTIMAFSICPVLLALLLVPLPGALAQEIPSPRDVLGFTPGDDFKLADWTAMVDYFDRLGSASDRVHVERMGRTTQGRDMVLVIVGSARNVARREVLMAGYRRLADPRGLAHEEADRLIADLPTAVFVGCAQHASEIASTQTSMNLAFSIAAGKDPVFETRPDDAILLLVPSLNPDGHQLVCDWYKEHLGTPFEGGRMPWLYHEYVGHDINRDWAMASQVETRHVSSVLYEKWFPQIVIDVHQMGRSGARMFIPPYRDPINPNIDPLIDHQLTLLAAQMQLDLSAAGCTGILTSAMFDEWLMGYFTSVPSRHNMVALLIEMASVNGASPVFQRGSDISSRALDGNARRANFVEPWPGGWWRLSDIVRYEHVALSSALKLAARNRTDWLRNFVQLGERQVKAGREEPPFAYLVPPDQRDPATTWKLVDTLQTGGVEVHRATAAFEADGLTWPDGTQVVFMAQPFRAHAKDLLEKQVYPNLRTYPGGPPDRPYDVAGWTLPLVMGVRAVEVVEPFEGKFDKVPRSKRPSRGRILGDEGDALLVDRAQNRAYLLVNRHLARGGEVECLTAPLDRGGTTDLVKTTFPAGSFLLLANEDDLFDEAATLGLHGRRIAHLPEGRRPLKAPRIGFYKPWTASMDEGWTRWVLERHEFPFSSIRDAEMRAGNLGARYDVILFPDLRGSSILRGLHEDSAPKKYVGGIGEAGLFALREFVREGGVVVGIDSSCPFLVEQFELPLEEVGARSRSSSERSGYGSREGDDGTKRFYCPGSILSLNVDTAHPLGYGLEAATPILFSSSPVFEKTKAKKEESPESGKDGKRAEPPISVAATYPGVNPLLSGWAENDELIRGKIALAEGRFGKGRVVLIAFRCQFRAQPYNTFKFLFNALLDLER